MLLQSQLDEEQIRVKLAQMPRGSKLYVQSNLSRRVRAFMKWIEDVLAPYLE